MVNMPNGVSSAAITASVSLNVAGFTAGLDAMVKSASKTVADIKTEFNGLNLSSSLKKSLEAIQSAMNELKTSLESMKGAFDSIGNIDKTLTDLLDTVKLINDRAAESSKSISTSIDRISSSLSQLEGKTSTSTTKVAESISRIGTSMNEVSTASSRLASRVASDMNKMQMETNMLTRRFELVTSIVNRMQSIGGRPLRLVDSASLSPLINQYRNLEASQLSNERVAQRLRSTLGRLGTTQLSNLDKSLASVQANMSNLERSEEQFKRTTSNLLPPAVNNQVKTHESYINNLARSYEKAGAACEAYFAKLKSQSSVPLLQPASMNYSGLTGGVGSLGSLANAEGLAKFNGEMDSTQRLINKTISDIQRLNGTKVQLKGLAGEYQQMMKLNGGVQVVERSLKNLNGTGLANVRSQVNQGYQALDKMEKSSKKTSTALNQSGKSANGFSNNVKKATNSVNALDKASGILRRTISGIFVIWGFNMAMETLDIAKNAADASYSIRKLGSDMNWSGQQTQGFIDKMKELQGIFPKIDMNETGKQVAEMARTYNLTNQQATDLIKTSAVFNSAMAKEGRTTRDASLALKDYLDGGSGWKRRMQEIGATEERLKETGLWNGDENDVTGKIKALDKYMSERGYDTMAMKIYNLNDAYNALKYSIGSLLGEGLEDLTPAIISATYAILGMITGLKQLTYWLKHDPLGKFVLNLMKIAGVGVGSYLVIYKVAKSLTAFAETMKTVNTVMKANKWVLFISLVITLGYAIYKSGQYMGLWKNWQDILQKISNLLDGVSRALGGIPLSTVLGTAIALTSSLMVAMKLMGKSTTDVLKKIVSGIKEVIKKLLQWKSTSEDTGSTTGKSKTPTETDKGKTPSGGSGDYNLTQALKVQAKNFVKNAVQIAMAFALVMEALALLYVTMQELSWIGSQYKSVEGNVKKGVEGIEVIVPLVTALMVPIIALMVVVNKYSISAKAMMSNFKSSALIIAEVLGLVAETIGLLGISLLELGAIGSNINVGSVQSGVNSIKALTPVLEVLMPPVIALMLITSAFGVQASTVARSFVSSALVIAEVLGLVAEAIALMTLPLMSLSLVGNTIDVGSVQKGVQAINSAKQVISMVLPPIIALFAVMSVVGGASLVPMAQGFVTSMVAIAMVMSLVAGSIAMFYPSLSVLANIGQNFDVASLNKGIQAIRSITTVIRTIQSLLASLPKGLGGLGGQISGIINLGAMTVVLGQLSTFARTLQTQFSGINLSPATVQKVANIIRNIKSVISAINGLNIGLGGAIKSVASTMFLSGYYISLQGISKFAQRIQAGFGQINVSAEAINRCIWITNDVKNIVVAIQRLATTLSNANVQYNATDKLNQVYGSVQGIVNFGKRITASAQNIAGIQGGAMSKLVGITNTVRSVATSVGRLATTLMTHPIPANFSGLMNRLYSAIQSVVAFNRKVSGANTNNGKGQGTSNVAGLTRMVNQIAIAINRMVAVVNSGANRLRSASTRLGNSFKTGVSRGVAGTGNLVRNQVNIMNSAMNSARGKSDQLGGAFTNLRRTVYTLTQGINNLGNAINGLPSSKSISIGIHTSTTNSGSLPAGLILAGYSMSSILGSNWDTIQSYTGGTASTGGRLFGLTGALKGLTKGFSIGFASGGQGSGRGASFDSVARSLIGATSYEHYYNSKNGGNIADSLESGSFNCYDGSLILMALASMFGLDAEMRGMMVGNEGHAYTVIDGQVYDPTAMQIYGRTKAPNVHYSADVSRPSTKESEKKDKDTNKNHIETTVVINGDVYGERDLKDKIKRGAEEVLIDIINPSKGSGI